MNVPATATTRTVHRFDLDPTGHPTTVDVHGSSQVVHTALMRTRRGPVARIWIEHDPAAPIAQRTFALVATGAPVPPLAVHAGVVVIGNRALHVYELGAGFLDVTVPDDLTDLLGITDGQDDEDDDKK